MAISADIWAAVGDVLGAALLGRQRDLGLEHLPGHLSHLGEDGQRGAANVMEVGRLQDVLQKKCAPIKERLDEEVMVHGVLISMDGRGRVFENMFVERLWRRVKYEEVYLKDDRSVSEAMNGLQAYFEFYNRERLHQSLNYQTPAAIYLQGPKCAAVTTFN